MKKKLILLTAPPASGKTFWIKSLIAELGHHEILVISPLRALTNECNLNWRGKVLVMTPEEWSTKKIYKKIVLFDEFHLNFYWGDAFRPLLWEVFFELSEQSDLVILLTATLSTSMRNEISEFKAQFDEIYWVDHGNQQLKNHPIEYVKLPNLKLMNEIILLSKPQATTHLIFCAYREEVRKWSELLEARGRRVWSCVGGEASAFSLRVQCENPPEFIVSTTVLSHGVNLPQISTIYFTYAVKNIDFWIQMVARGGRRGEDYRVFSLEDPHGIQWSKWTNHLAILKLRFKISYHKFKGQFSQWFLKD